jgi:hypothetical protein
MHLLFSADRLVTLLASAAAIGAGDTASEPMPWPAATRAPHPVSPDPLPDDGCVDGTWRSHLETILRWALVGDPDQLCDALTSDASGWSPTGTFRSRTEVEERRREHATSLCVEDCSIDRLWWQAPTLIAEWNVRAVHDAPLLVAENVLIERTGHRVTLAGVSVAVLEGDRIARLHSYFDDASVIEQILIAASSQRDRSSRS